MDARMGPLITRIFTKGFVNNRATPAAGSFARASLKMTGVARRIGKERAGAAQPPQLSPSSPIAALSSRTERSGVKDLVAILLR